MTNPSTNRLGGIRLPTDRQQFALVPPNAPPNLFLTPKLREEIEQKKVAGPAIVKKVKNQQAKLEEEYNPIELMHTLNISGVDYDGQLSAQCHGAGFSVGVTAGVGADIGPLKAKIKIEGQVTGLQYLMIILRYLHNRTAVLTTPKSETKQPNESETTSGTEQSSESESTSEGNVATIQVKSYESLLEKPICLMSLRGYKAKASLTLEASAGFEAEKETPTFEGHGLALGFQAEAKIGGTIEGEVIILRDVRPEMFPSFNDAKIPTIYAALQGKSNINSLLEGLFKARTTELNYSTIFSGRAKLQQDLEMVCANGTEEWKERNNIIENAPEIFPEPGGESQYKTARWGLNFLAQFFGVLRKDVTLDQLINGLRLMRLYDEINHKLKPKLTSQTTPETGTQATSAKESELAQILGIYDKLIQAFENEKSGNIPLDEGRAGLCNLFLWGVSAGFEAIAGIEATASVSKTEEGKRDDEAEEDESDGKTGGKVGASAGATGKIGRTVYQLQTWVDRDHQARHIMVNSTETVVDYRQVEVSAQAVAEVQGNLNKTVEKTAKANYNLLTYRSANLFWFPHVQNLDTRTATLLEGTGMSFGMSINIERLRMLVQAVRSDTLEANQQARSLLNTLAKQLRIDDPNTLERFLRRSVILDDFYINVNPPDRASIQARHRKLRDFYPVEELILESSFRFKKPEQKDASFEVPLKYYSSNQKPITYSDPATKEEKKVPYGYELTESPMKVLYGDGKTFRDDFALQSIRLRYRIADIQTEEKQLFERSFPLGFVDVGFKLSKVEEAGSAGMVDLETYWIQPDLKRYNYSPEIDLKVTDIQHDGTEGKTEIVREVIHDSKEAYNHAVPPVALLHQ